MFSSIPRLQPAAIAARPAWRVSAREPMITISHHQPDDRDTRSTAIVGTVAFRIVALCGCFRSNGEGGTLPLASHGGDCRLRVRRTCCTS